MRVLVTGGAGFIGSNLVRSLIAGGDEVTVLDNMSTGSVKNLSDVGADINLVRGDIRDEGMVGRLARHKDLIYHLAALPSVARSIENPQATYETNVVGTSNVLEAALRNAVPSVVYASSSSVYGNTPTLPKHEDMNPCPLSPYAWSKLAGETLCRAFAHSFGMHVVGLRYFNVFGPRQDPSSQYAAVIPRFITAMLADEPPVIFGDGQQTRDFTPVGNVVQACRLAAAAGPDASGEAINVGCNSRISLLHLVQTLNDLLGTDLSPVLTDPRPGDVRDSQAAIDKAERLIGYRPLTSLDHGLAATVEWFRSAARAPVHSTVPAT